MLPDTANPLKLLGRMRRSGGFGVHSPLAYSLITDVLRPGRGYALYAYGDMATDKRLRQWMRIVAWAGPTSVWIEGDVSGLYRKAAMSVMPSALASRSPAQARLLYCRGSLPSQLHPGQVAVIDGVPMERVLRLWESSGSAICLTGGARSAARKLIVCRDDLPHIRYDLFF